MSLVTVTAILHMSDENPFEHAFVAFTSLKRRLEQLESVTKAQKIELVQLSEELVLSNQKIHSLEEEGKFMKEKLTVFEKRLATYEKMEKHDSDIQNDGANNDESGSETVSEELPIGELPIIDSEETLEDDYEQTQVM